MDPPGSLLRLGGAAFRASLRLSPPLRDNAGGVGLVPLRFTHPTALALAAFLPYPPCRSRSKVLPSAVRLIVAFGNFRYSMFLHF